MKNEGTKERVKTNTLARLYWLDITQQCSVEDDRRRRLSRLWPVAPAIAQNTQSAFPNQLCVHKLGWRKS
eukprot:2718831-Rhodomonas_salina.1